MNTSPEAFRPFALVSIIMPVYNAEKYLPQAIKSVLNQSHPYWELLIVNDGSTDSSSSIVKNFSDVRIKYFEKQNGGVSSARNLALQKMRGDYFCFLDADDMYPSNSLKSRLDVFEVAEKELQFVDGKVEEWNTDLTKLQRLYIPTYHGSPVRPMLRLSESCYLGQTWMIRRIPSKHYSMRQDLTHGEDFLFLLQLARSGGRYSFTKDLILKYRRHATSAMNNLEGLNAGYLKIFHVIKSWNEVSAFEALVFWAKSRKIMFLSFLFIGKSFAKAIKSLFQL